MNMQNGQENLISQDVLIFMIELYRKEARIAKLEDIMAKFNITKFRVQTILKILISQGYLDLNYNKYSFSQAIWNEIHSQKKDPKEIIKIPSTEDSPKEAPKPKSDMLFDSWVILSVRIVMIVIGGCASIVSAYFNYFRLQEYCPPVIAVIVATVVVAFLTISFEAMVIFFRKRVKYQDSKGLIKHRRPLAPIAAVFLVTWIFASVFSMSSIIAGMYNRKVANMKVSIEKNFGQIYKEKQFGIYSDKETDIQSSLDESKLEYDMAKKQWLDNGGSTTNKSYWTYKMAQTEWNRWKLKKANNEDNKLNMLIREKAAGITKDTSVSIPNFYNWLSAVLKNRIGSDMVEFLMNLFPALFMDIIAPLSIAVALFLTNSRKENENT